MKRRNILKPAAEEGRKLRLKDRMIILSRRDRMGKAMPTWYRVLAVVLILAAGLVFFNRARRDRLENQTVRPEPLVHGTLRISFAGDLKLSRNVETLGRSVGYETLFDSVSPLWQDSSLVFAALEGVVLTGQEAPEPIETEETPFAISTEALSAAAKAGLNAYSLATDHSFDYGSEGLRQTVSALESMGLSYAGAGENLPAAGMYRVLEAEGMRIGFLACSAVNPNGPGPIDDYCLTTTAYSALYRNVLLASDETDLVVVYVCWGEQDGIAVSDAQRRVAHQLIQSGADIVIGTHPHVLQPVEQYRNGWIFYSLGSLVTDLDQRGERESALLRLDLDAETGEGSFTLIPLMLEDFSPTPSSNKMYINQIQHSLLRELFDDCYTVSDDGRITIPFSVS